MVTYKVYKSLIQEISASLLLEQLVFRLELSSVKLLLVRGDTNIVVNRFPVSVVLRSVGCILWGYDRLFEPIRRRSLDHELLLADLLEKTEQVDTLVDRPAHCQISRSLLVGDPSSRELTGEQAVVLHDYS